MFEADATPRPSSPTSVPPSLKHITDFKKSPVPTSDESIAPLKILVVEDEVRSPLLLARFLSLTLLPDLAARQPDYHLEAIEDGRSHGYGCGARRRRNPQVRGGPQLRFVHPSCSFFFCQVLTSSFVADIVLMDLQMPICNGLDASLGIREVEKNSPIPPQQQRPSHLLNRRIPIIAVTASLPERDRQTIVDAKLDGWLRAFLSFPSLLLPRRRC